MGQAGLRGSDDEHQDDRLVGDVYDANGNTTDSLDVASTYDFENHMLTHGNVNLVYDGDGNRVSETVGSTTTKFLVDDKNPTGYPQVLDETVNGAVTRTYAYGLSRISEDQLINGAWTPSFYGYYGGLAVLKLCSTGHRETTRNRTDLAAAQAVTHTNH